MRVSNNKARDYVNGLHEFQGSNMFGKWIIEHEGHEDQDKGTTWNVDVEKIYVVYSYGHHFPMYIYDKEQGKWIGNKDKYSRSTTRHQSLARPSGEEITWLDTNEMQSIVRWQGLVRHTINKAQQ